MTVVKRLLASSPAQLDLVGCWLHDAALDPSLVADDERRIVTLPFAQERLDADDRLPGAARVRHTWLFEEYALPLLRCRLTVRNAAALLWPGDVDDVYELTGLDYDQRKGIVRVWTNRGSIDIPAAPLDLELTVTDEIDSIKRRRVGRGRRWDSTGNWPAEQEERVAALVAQVVDPLPPHIVSAITRPPPASSMP